MWTGPRGDSPACTLPLPALPPAAPLPVHALLMLLQPVRALSIGPAAAPLIQVHFDSLAVSGRVALKTLFDIVVPWE